MINTNAIFELTKSRTELLSWIPKTGFNANENDDNGAYTKYKFTCEQVGKIDKLIEKLN